MKNTIIFLSFCVLSNLSFAQVPKGSYTDATKLWNEKIEWQQEREPEDYKTFTSTFVSIFNSNNLSEILNHSSASLLDKTDPQKLVGFLV